MNYRKISKLFKGRPTIEGAGVHLKRGFGYSQVPQFDPFLMLDDFHTDVAEEYLPGFPWHPHRGIETITYLLEGAVEHGDSMGNKGVIGAGDVQWMTAGSGIIHQEMPQLNPGAGIWGFQIWANLPASHKMMPPRYQEIKSDQIPTAVLDSGVIARVIAGEIAGVRGPVRDIVIEPEMLDISMPALTTLSHRLPSGHTAFAYVLSGEGEFDQQQNPYSYEVVGHGWSDLERCISCKPETVVFFEHEGDGLLIRSLEKPLRFLLLSGRPLGEPVAWYGPIVMNSREELRIAFEEYNNGTFVK